ncbi:hypothetical protein LTR56_012880 [Elasticomyces elasticus]|nr:hypothetical protein LTR56_012880 [Elasticomyces elasticus]KAK3650806.1 hypothetical protein LTR22_012405 [Elasticomyces elasticus]KAK4918510.1 hypothetical protein LTR49_013743 [Elasticomyces elasticus]KAK5757852.1 hypothetical protein LTS12_012036 [Elasticomyces elasticus]
MRTTIIFLAVATMATTITAAPLYKENGLFKPYYGGHGPVCSPEFPCPGVSIPPRPLEPIPDDLNHSMWLNGVPENQDATVEARSWEEHFDANGNIIPNPDMPAVDKKRSSDWVPAEWSGDEEYNEEYPEVNVTEYPEVNVTEYPEVNVTEYPEVNVTEYPDVNVEEYNEEYYPEIMNVEHEDDYEGVYIGEDIIPIAPSRPSSDE